MAFPALAQETAAQRGEPATTHWGVVAGPDDWIPGWRDLAILVALAASLAILAAVHATGLLYALVGLAFAGLLLTSAIVGWRRRRANH